MATSVLCWKLKTHKSEINETTSANSHCYAELTGLYPDCYLLSKATKNHLTFKVNIQEL